MLDIPLINESIIYAKKIDKIAKTFGFGRFRHKKLVNLIQKYDANFLSLEMSEFLKDPNNYKFSKLNSQYFGGSIFFDSEVNKKILIKIMVKFIFHRLFSFLGFCQKIFISDESIIVARKVYVDDVDGLFDDREGVTWFIYPFPLNVFRQYRYVRYLGAAQKKFMFYGVPYLFSDLVNLLRKPTYSNLCKLESRGQILHALKMKEYKNLELIQCAEEYELGSLTFSLAVKRQGIGIHNCAHGAGKYLPYHSYTKFEVLTAAQKEYYDYFNALDHDIKKIKKNSLARVDCKNQKVIILLGQSSISVSSLIKDDESKILNLFNGLAKEYEDVLFAYKKHPNCEITMFDEFDKIKVFDKELLNGARDKLLQLSLFSTCQVDPNFMGTKILVETEFIKPFLAYGDYEPIVNFIDLNNYLLRWIKSENDDNC